MVSLADFKELTPYLWEIPKSFRHDMLVPARVYASKDMLLDILDEKAISQLINVAALPGVKKYVLAMPDIHQGYGFPIGGVAAIDPVNGVISPGGVGYDINCGVRLLASKYRYAEISNQLVKLANKIMRNVPSGVGRSSELALGPKDLDQVLNTGLEWAVKNGYAFPFDSEMLEENGCYPGADAKCVSEKAKARGKDQLGTMGAGNHFLEIQKVVEIYDEKVAKVFGLFPEQITIMIHTGSRGLGHQVCTDYVKILNQKLASFANSLPDPELIFAPFNSREGQNYFKAMAASANFAWVNRQIITDQIRNSWIQVLGGQKEELGIVYDVAHNIAKLERYEGKDLLIHRKGATRAFGPKQEVLPVQYQAVGQPVFIPGSMGTYSYVLVGTEKAMQETFGSTCHGAGRRMSRMKSKKNISYANLLKELEDYGVIVRAASIKGLVEEAPEAYKDIESVVDVVDKAGIAKKIAKLKPVAIIKG